MRKITATATALVAVLAAFALPAFASLADRAAGSSRSI